MASYELVSGQRLWEINIAGISTPAVAGEWVFVVTDEAQLLCISRANGHIRWISQLPRWRDQKDKKGRIGWTGPVLASDRLVLVSSQGQVAYVSPFDGAIQSTVETREATSLPPVVANNSLYILHDNGELTAFR